MTKKKLRELLQQYFENAITEADCKELLTYLETCDPEDIAPVMDEVLLSLPDTFQLDQNESATIFDAIQNDVRYNDNLGLPQERQRISDRWYYAAASLLLLLSIGFLYFSPSTSHHAQLTIAKAQPQTIIQPGSKKATLTLGNGKVIDLESEAQGLLRGTGNAGIRKVKSGQIVYQDNQNSAEIALNNLQTPKGGEYQITLPDGTRVWLNSASSLLFPAAFKGAKRQVILKGEAYFEVAKNKMMPFIVSVGKTEIKVLGTHFNVAAYQDDEITTTTLLEGAVELSTGGNTRLLRPGQKASISRNSNDIAVSEANIAQAMAWKNGYFRFDDQDIRSIMKQVSRWYDVEVEFKQKNLSTKQFGGTFYRSKGIAELLSHLEELDPHIHFKITGRRVEIME